MIEYITACPRNCYSTCSFIVQVTDNRIKRILPYPGNRATRDGPCVKGLSALERAYSPDRIIHPLRKTENGFRQISAEEALDLVAGRLKKVIEMHGPHSVLWYRGSGMSGLVNETGSAFWKALGGATTTYGNLCWPAGLEAVRLTLGEVKHNVPWDLENARTIILWGKNSAETNIHEISFIAGAREKGCRVIAIDPRHTPTADKADLLLSPVPGTDAALALAAARIIIEENLADMEFIGKHVRGFDEFRKSLSITPAGASQITGIPAECIISLAHDIAYGSPVTIIPGYGLQRHVNGGQTIRAILALNIITGNIGRSGAGFNYANLQSYVFDSVREPLSYYPDPETDKPFRRTISMTRLGTDMLNATDPALRAAWVERGNPILQSPDSGNVRKAFKNLDFIVAVEQFMTDTAAMADIILPAKDIFEQSDILGSYWSPYVSFKPGITMPPGEVLPESSIYYNLALRMGLGISSDQLPEPGNDNIEKWLENRISGFTPLRLDDLRHGPVLAPGLEEIAYGDFRFATPSGMIELLSEEAHDRWGVTRLPGYSPATRSRRAGELHLITPNASGAIHSQYCNLELIREVSGDRGAALSPAEAGIRGIKDGDRIRIFNGNGELFTTATLSIRVPSGLIVLHNGIWTAEGGGGNNLISGEFTDMGYGSAFHDTLVEAEKATPA